MSYLTMTTKRPHGDEWIQLKCDGDGCGALGPRVEIVTPRTKDGKPKRELVSDAVFKLAKQVTGFAEQTRPGRTKNGRTARWWTVADLCPACAFKARVNKLIADLGGPFGPPPDERSEEM